MNKETSSRVSTIASKLMDLDRNRLEGIAYEYPGYQTTDSFIDDIKTVAASALSQDETPGQEKPKRKDRPEISATIDGAKITIHVDYGSTVYHSHFSGDEKVRDMAIDILIEKICGFSRNQILILLENPHYTIESTEKGNGND